MTLLIDYITNIISPNDKDKSRQIKTKAAIFSMIEGELFKRSFTYLSCIAGEKIQNVLAKLHDGECGNHSGTRSLAHKALTFNYYWPTMRDDSVAYVRKCDKCQRFAPIPNNH